MLVQLMNTALVKLLHHVRVNYHLEDDAWFIPGNSISSYIRANSIHVCINGWVNIDISVPIKEMFIITLYVWLCRTYMYTLQTDMCVCKLMWPCVYKRLHKCVCTSVHACPHMCTCFLADFSVCNMRVACVSHACCIELVANLYRT